MSLNDRLDREKDRLWRHEDEVADALSKFKFVKAAQILLNMEFECKRLAEPLVALHASLQDAGYNPPPSLGLAIEWFRLTERACRQRVNSLQGIYECFNSSQGCSQGCSQGSLDLAQIDPPESLSKPQFMGLNLPPNATDL